MNAAVGDLWFDTTDGRLFIYYQDFDSFQWVDASPAGGGGGEELDIPLLPPLP